MSRQDSRNLTGRYFPECVQSRRLVISWGGNIRSGRERLNAEKRRRYRWYEAEVRRACVAMLSGAGQGGPETLGECIRAVAAARGRNIVVIPGSLVETEIFGIWFALDDYDLILVDADASRAHRSHIVGHELGHIILGHDVIPDGSASDREIPARCRKSLDTPQEAEAELFARILQSELHKRQSRGYRRLRSAAARRIASSLDRPL